MRLLIRADASTTMGTGHVMRSLALAQALREDGATVRFAHAEITPALRARLAAEEFTAQIIPAVIGSDEDARQTATLAREQDADWVVADGYCFGISFQERIRAAGCRLLLITDLPAGEPIVSDLLLNQNLQARRADYPNRAVHTQLLLGPAHAILRREFCAWRDRTREIRPEGRRVLVTLGGSDPDNVTARLMDALATLPGIEVRVVIGGSNPHRADLEARARHAGDRLQCIVDASDMPALMDWTDVAIAAGGSTCWELALLGVPSVLVVLAENQAAVAAQLHERGIMVSMGATFAPERVAQTVGGLLADPARRQELGNRARALVDGRGVDRVVAALQAPRVELHPATPEDCRRIWEWANAPAVRVASFHADPIPWEIHVAWFQRRITDPAVRLLVAWQDGVPVGQIRFEPGLGDVVVSLSLAPGREGRGLGSALIKAGCERCFAETTAAVIHAYTKPDNLPSLRAFAKAGFASHGEIRLGNQPAIHLTLAREPT